MNNTSKRQARDALLKVLASREINKRPGLEKVWETMLDDAAAGDQGAARFVVETLDGKAPQAVTHSGDIENPVALILQQLGVIRSLPMLPVPPSDDDEVV